MKLPQKLTPAEIAAGADQLIADHRASIDNATARSACWFVKTLADSIGGGRENERRVAQEVRARFFSPEVKS